ncbi:kinase-like protein [Daldinia vernicosa]|uniref:kinase-like protein n=1 Tax=Daldinia vernicosa TaxID=114800 RepID=UPI002008C896|nr:kinase-like protein [Daldinia vernicosa]KAI0846554.1 kinase-like protein [Daldinia vernicosa]
MAEHGGLAGPDEVSYDPSIFEEKYRAQNWRFSRYRQFGHREPSSRQFAQNRAQWLAHPFPRAGSPQIRGGGEEFPSFYYNPYIREGVRTLNERALNRLEEARNYFIHQGRFDYIRPLGYGGLGLTIQFKWRGSEVGREDRDIVLKIGLKGWVSLDIRDEEEMTRQMSRAAHVIQAIDPVEVGMPPKTKFVFPEVPRYDSSDEGESSGDESRSDEPAQGVPTRRWRMENEPEQMLEKIRLHEERLAARRAELSTWAKTFKTVSTLISRGEEVDPQLIRSWDLEYKDFLLLEFMQLGDLAHAISKIHGMDGNIPNRVLWSFWHCLVKACIAMCYPPRKFHPRRRGRPQDHADEAEIDDLRRRQEAGEDVVVGKTLGNDLFEEIPVAKRRWARKNLVHFDIDPSNIFIAPPDFGARDGEHDLIPRLKLADFGCARFIKQNKGNAYYLERRRMAKQGYFAPEQFGIEWEHIAPVFPDGWELSEQPVAGNYWSAMNIWGIAWSMWMLITGCHVPDAPQRHEPEDPSEPIHYCPAILDDFDYGNVDRELRETIAACMRHDPRDRPTLIELSEQATRNTKKMFPGEYDDVIEAWVLRIFFQPEGSADDDDASASTTAYSPGDAEGEPMVVD